MLRALLQPNIHRLNSDDNVKATSGQAVSKSTGNALETTITLGIADPVATLGTLLLKNDLKPQRKSAGEGGGCFSARFSKPFLPLHISFNKVPKKIHFPASTLLNAF